MKKTFIGEVVSTKMQQSAVVEVQLLKKHRIYQKRYRQTVRFLAHNPSDTYKLGDRVEITETRPLSKLKRWQITGRVPSDIAKAKQRKVKQK